MLPTHGLPCSVLEATLRLLPNPTMPYQLMAKRLLLPETSVPHQLKGRMSNVTRFARAFYCYPKGEVNAI